MASYGDHLRKSRRLDEALEWYRRAGLAGDPNGMEWTGLLLATGEGGLSDVVAASLWLELAWRRGRAEAGRVLAFASRLGWSGPADLARAIERHRSVLAAARRPRDDVTLELLTTLAERGEAGDLDAARALQPRLRGARARLARVVLAVAAGGAPGEEARLEEAAREAGVSPYHAEALRRWRARAAGVTEGTPPTSEVERLVAGLRATRGGPPEDAAAAARAAAEAGAAEGMVALAEALVEGRGLASDRVAAAAWLDRAAAAGAPDAVLRLGQVVLTPGADPFGASDVDVVLAALDRAEAQGPVAPAHRTVRAEALLRRAGPGDAAAAASSVRAAAPPDPRGALLLAEALAAGRVPPLDEREAQRLLDAVLADPAAASLHARAHGVRARLDGRRGR